MAAAFTEAAIQQTFLELLEKHPIHEITVKELTKACGINRNTFYYHYQDIPDLLESIVQEECDRIIQAYPSLESLEECLQVATTFARENRKVVLHIYHSADRAIYETHLWRICQYAVYKYGETVFSGEEIDSNDAQIILRYYTCECFGQVMAWMENGMQEDISASFCRLCELKQGQLEEMIRRSRNG